MQHSRTLNDCVRAHKKANLDFYAKGFTVAFEEQNYSSFLAMLFIGGNFKFIIQNDT